MLSHFILEYSFLSGLALYFKAALLLKKTLVYS
jgi:hypothetical protein